MTTLTTPSYRWRQAGGRGEGAAVDSECRGASSGFYRHPSSFGLAAQDRLADRDLAVAIRKAGIVGRRAAIDHGINGPEQLLECIRKSLVMSARVVRVTSRFGVQERRIANQQLVGPIAMSQPELVGPFAVPGH